MLRPRKRNLYRFISILVVVFIPLVSVAYSALQTVLNIRATIATEGLVTVTYDCEISGIDDTIDIVNPNDEYTLQDNLCGNKIVAGSGNGTSATPNVYRQIGWSLTSGGNAVSSINLTENITLYPAYDKLFTYSGNYQVIDDGNGDYRVRFLDSANLTILQDTIVDLFLVGGGGGGASSNGAGGGGGYTTTSAYNTLEADTTYTLTIGAGGATATAGSRSAITQNSLLIAYADGGDGASGTTGGDGGSGGGVDTAGGINGNNGTASSATTYGMGQGITTCEFGNITGSSCNTGYNLYATGGTGKSAGASGAANTGNGGDGGSTGGAGGSGIIVLSNYKETTKNSHSFKYTGDIQTVTFNRDSTCELKVWGAQGAATDRSKAGIGGYSTGTKTFSPGDFYVVVGGKGAKAGGDGTYKSGGYNGGGSSRFSAGSGGGATHIASTTGLLSTLSSNVESIYIVAGGGGGGGAHYWYSHGGAGGGLTGGTGSSGNGGNGTSGGGTQTAGGNSGGAFGQGGTGGYKASGGDYHGSGGGGGGYYGGGGGTSWNHGGGGGSGYIDGVINGSTTNGVAGSISGNGFATISCSQYSDTWYVITYDNNGGSGCTYKTVDINNEYGELCIPTREQYIFSGWYTELANGELITSSSIVDGDRTIHAIWQPWWTGQNQILYSGTYGVGLSLSEAKNNTYTNTFYSLQENDQIYLLTAGTLTLSFSDGIDVFLVGGGGAGGSDTDTKGGGGGGGGHVYNAANVLLNGTSCNVTIGAGGSGSGNSGKATSFVCSYANINYTAAGGSGASLHGGSGGSGGGAGGYNGCPTSGGNGGSNGSDGGGARNNYGGDGDGITTCEFGQGVAGASSCTNNVTMYAGGGGGGKGYSSTCSEGAGSNGTGTGSANTGGGGHGGSAKYGGTGSGYSGVVVIRKHVSQE